MRFAKIARIEDFMPDSVDWGNVIGTGYLERVRNEIANAENDAMEYMARQAAKEIRAGGRAAERAIVGRANNNLVGSAISAGGRIALAGADAGWFGGGSPTDPGTFGDGLGTGHVDYSWNADPLNYEPGSISSPGWSWSDL